MSFPDISLVLAPRAKEDIVDIMQYTLETWGEAQVPVYRAKIHQALASIQRYPLIGHIRPELSPTHRVFPVGRHLVIYRPSDAAIYVSRFLHERMDLARYF